MWTTKGLLTERVYIDVRFTEKLEKSDKLLRGKAVASDINMQILK